MVQVAGGIDETFRFRNPWHPWEQGMWETFRFLLGKAQVFWEAGAGRFGPAPLQKNE